MIGPRSVFIHEDDDDMIEFLPLAAWGHCAAERGVVHEFAHKRAVRSPGGTVVGYDDIYVRGLDPSVARAPGWE